MSFNMENKTVVECISKYYLSTELADVQFAFNNGTVTVPAHKTILAMKSDVFAAMFFGALKEDAIVTIVDAEATAFKEFLQFFYLPKVVLSTENITSVARLADKYNILDCVNTCTEVIKTQLNEDNIFWGYQLAVSLNHQGLKKICERIIELLDSEKFNSESFLKCDALVVENILKLDSLKCSERYLFNSCVAWAKSSCRENGLDEKKPENVKGQLVHCWNLFRFGSMSHEDIMLMLSDPFHIALFDPDELNHIFRMKSGEIFQSNIFEHKQRLQPILYWRREDAIDCSFVNLDDGHERYNLTERETTRFTTSTILMLRRITFIRIQSSEGTGHCIPYKMKIVRLNKSDTAKVTTEYPCGEIVTFTSGHGCPSVLFKKPVIIWPNAIYEVQMERTSSNAGQLYHTTEWISEVEFAKGITVTVLDSQTDQKLNSKTGGGLVRCLTFNRL